MRFFFILFFYLISVSVSQAETFDDFSARLDSWAEGLKGVIASSDNVRTVIAADLGKSANVAAGMTFTASREGESLYHPVTNELLGKKKIITGKLTVTGVEDKYAVCKPDENNGLQKGDTVSHELPIPIAVSFSGLSEREAAEAKFAVLKSGLFREDAGSRYGVSCFREKAGDSVAKCILKFNDKTVIQTDIAVKGMKIISTSSSENGGKTLKDAAVFDIGGNAVSAAAGYLYGKDKGLAVAVTNGSGVTIYKYDGGILSETETIGGFKQVVSVEIADINDNGIDELFISCLNKEKKSDSAVFEFNGEKMRSVQTNIPYLFRSYYINGKKEVAGQGYNDGAIFGMIYRVSFSKESKEYQISDPYTESYGAGLFGFACGKIGGKSADETIFFNNKGVLCAAFNGEIHKLKDNYFSRSPNYIIYTEKLSTGVTVGNTGNSGGYFVYDQKNMALPVYQRIIESGKGKLLFYSNIPAKKRATGTEKYYKSSIGEYVLIGSQIIPVWEEDTDTGAAFDTDITPDGKYIVLLLSKGFGGLKIGGMRVKIFTAS